MAQAVSTNPFSGTPATETLVDSEKNTKSLSKTIQNAALFIMTQNVPIEGYVYPNKIATFDGACETKRVQIQVVDNLLDVNRKLMEQIKEFKEKEKARIAEEEIRNEWVNNTPPSVLRLLEDLKKDNEQKIQKKNEKAEKLELVKEAEAKKLIEIRKEEAKILKSKIEHDVYASEHPVEIKGKSVMDEIRICQVEALRETCLIEKAVTELNMKSSLLSNQLVKLESLHANDLENALNIFRKDFDIFKEEVDLCTATFTKAYETVNKAITLSNKHILLPPCEQFNKNIVIRWDSISLDMSEILKTKQNFNIKKIHAILVTYRRDLDNFNVEVRKKKKGYMETMNRDGSGLAVKTTYTLKSDHPILREMVDEVVLGKEFFKRYEERISKLGEIYHKEIPINSCTFDPLLKAFFPKEFKLKHQDFLFLPENQEALRKRIDKNEEHRKAEWALITNLTKEILNFHLDNAVQIKQIDLGSKNFFIGTKGDVELTEGEKPAVLFNTVDPLLLYPANFS